MTANNAFERTSRQRRWQLPARLRRSAAAQRERQAAVDAVQN
jgi:hypothetical protein